MKLLFYLSRFPAVGGIESVTTTIIRRLKEFGWDIEIISHVHADINNPLDDIILHHTPIADYSCGEYNFNFVENIVKNGGFDAIIYQDSYAPTEKIVTSISEKYNVPLFVFEHNSPLFVKNKRDLEPWYRSFKSFLRRPLHPYLLYRDRKRKKLLLRYASKYVLLSKQFISDFREVVGAKTFDRYQEKITYINNPIQSRATNIDLTLKKKEIIYVGRLVEEKKVDRVLDIWRLISHTLKDWSLTIVGSGPLEDELKEKTTTLERISFEGFQKPDPYYERASIMLMTSKFEGWPMTLLESMQHGVVPIAVNNFSSLIDIIDNELNGIIIPKSDTDEKLGERVMALANNTSKLKRMQANAIIKSEDFTLDVIIKQWRNLLEYADTSSD